MQQLFQLDAPKSILNAWGIFRISRVPHQLEIHIFASCIPSFSQPMTHVSGLIYPIKYFLWSPPNSYKINFFNQDCHSLFHAQNPPKHSVLVYKMTKKRLTCQISLQIRHACHSREAMAAREPCPSGGNTSLCEAFRGGLCLSYPLFLLYLLGDYLWEIMISLSWSR